MCTLTHSNKVGQVTHPHDKPIPGTLESAAGKLVFVINVVVSVIPWVVGAERFSGICVSQGAGSMCEGLFELCPAFYASSGHHEAILATFRRWDLRQDIKGYARKLGCKKNEGGPAIGRCPPAGSFFIRMISEGLRVTRD